MLTAYNDPLGVALSDYYFHKKRNRKIDVYCSVSGYETIPVKHFFRSYDQMPEIEQKGLSLCKGRILDVGAGAGCHSIILQNKRLDVTSLELSLLSCDIMNARGLNQVLNHDFYNINKQKYDTLLMLMNGAGISQKLSNLPAYFSHCRDLLNKDGIIILDSSDLIYLFDEDETEHDWDKDYYGEVTYKLTYGNIEGEPFEWLFIDFKTLDTYARQNGFTCTKIMEDDHFGYLAVLKIN